MFNRLVLPVAAASVGALGVGAAGDSAGDTVLDGDGLHGGSLGQGHGGGLKGARSGRSAAVQRVADFSTALCRHRHLGALGELGSPAEGRSRYGRGLSAA